MNEPNGMPRGPWARLALVPAKLRKKGLLWLVTRARQESNRITNAAIIEIIRRWRRIIYLLDPEGQMSRGTLFAIYDLNYYPVSFDICWFLIWADIERQRRGLERVHFVFVPADETKREYPKGYDAVIDQASRAWRFHNIVVAASAFLPSASGITLCQDRNFPEVIQVVAEHLFPKTLTWQGGPPSLAEIRRQTTAALSAQASSWTGLRATAQGVRYIQQWLAANAKGLKPVVITFRQYGVDPDRNSNIAEWVAFARGLDATKYFPIIVPDTDASLRGQPECEGLTVFHPAAWNLGLRMALYESAYLNLLVTSGPLELCVLNPRCSYLFFKVEVPSTELASLNALNQMGFEKNKTPPFATPLQKWVWEDDDRDVIAREFEAMVARIESGRHISQERIPQISGDK